MSYYYGVLRGGRRGVTRCGTKNSGIVATLSTFGALLEVSLVGDCERNPTVHIRIRIGDERYGEADLTLSELFKIVIKGEIK